MAKSKIFFWVLLAFIAGVAQASFIRLPQYLTYGFFLLGSAGFIFGLLDAGPRTPVWTAAIMLTVFSLGTLRFGVADQGVGGAISGRGPVVLEGVIVDEPTRDTSRQHLVFKEEKSQSKILITARPYPEYRYGDELHVSGVINPPQNFSPSFDYAAYLAKDNIFSVMVFPEISVMSQENGNWLFYYLFYARRLFVQKLESFLPEPHAAFAAGLMLGARKTMPPDLNEKLQATGTSHLVALSGYNITIVADALLKALMFLRLPFSWAFGFAVSGIILFTLLTGASASVVRAAVMGILVLIARREGRRYHMRNALAFAGAFMLFLNPKVLRFDMGFQLSFLATLGLLYGAPVVERVYEQLKTRARIILRNRGLLREVRGEARPKPRQVLKNVIIPTLAAQLFVLPLLLLRFGRVSLVSPLANLFLLPVIPFTMAAVFLASLGAFVSRGLGLVLGAAAWLFLEYELWAIDFFSRWPYASLSLPEWAGILFAGISVAMILFLSRKRPAHESPS